jgi:hypothetical protein
MLLLFKAMIKGNAIATHYAEVSYNLSSTSDDFLPGSTDYSANYALTMKAHFFMKTKNIK